MRVAVVGAGASGLTAVKTLVEEGLEPVCFERTDDIGGLWKYTDNVKEGQASVMKSTVINTSKEMMCYSDFPIPTEYPVFMHNTLVYQYFQLYAKHFNLHQYIHLQTQVEHIKPSKDFDATGCWDVRVKDNVKGKTEDLVFDAVLLCTGHHAEKNTPDFPGLHKFKGKVVHSHDYKNITGYEDRRIVIIGIGNSGGDAAVELSRVAKQVYLSTRRGSWILNRVAEKGMPLDLQYTSRAKYAFMQRFPNIVNKEAAKKLNERFDHAAYSLKPQTPPFSMHPMVNDDLPNRIISGSVIIKPDIETFTERGVKFVDGTFVDDIDVAFLATGYVFGFPFLDKSVINVVKNEAPLFKFMFPPNLKHQTLAVIGFIQPLGALMPISELQSRLASRVFKKEVSLPSRTDMMADIQDKRDKMAARYVKSQRHTIQVDYISYMDELAELYGCKPVLKKLLFSDFDLFKQVVFGPCTPYQFRLHGPHAWKGARKAIMTQWERTLAPLKTRPLGFEEQKSQFGFVIFFFVFVCLFVGFLSIFL